MRRFLPLSPLCCFALLLVLVVTGCAAGTSSRGATATATATLTPTPAGVLVFSSTGKRTFDSNGNATEHSTTTLTDLNPATGAITWKTPAYSGQPIQQPVVVGTRALFAIGANLSSAPTAQAGTVSLYAADLTTGAITPLGTLSQIYFSSFTYLLSLSGLNATTAVLTYARGQGSGAVSTLLAFTSTPSTPLWTASLPDATVVTDMTVFNGSVVARAYNSATKTHTLIAFNGADGSILWQAPLAGIRVTGGRAYADSMLIQTQSASANGTSGWELAAYSLHDGSLVWKQAVANFDTTIYGAADGLVLHPTGPAGQEATTLAALNTSSGSPAWTTPLLGYASVDSDPAHLYVTFTGGNPQITCLTSADGKTVWSHTWPSTQTHQLAMSAPQVAQGSVYFGLSAYNSNGDPTVPSTVYALSAADGSTLWHQTITGWLQYPVATDRA